MMTNAIAESNGYLAILVGKIGWTHISRVHITVAKVKKPRMIKEMVSSPAVSKWAWLRYGSYPCTDWEPRH